MGSFEMQGRFSSGPGWPGLLIAAVLAFAVGVGWEYRPHLEARLPIPLLHPRVALPDGLRVQRDAAIAQLAEARPAVQRREAAVAAITADVAQTITKTQTVYRDRFVTLTNEVQTYVPPEADRQCLVGVGVVRLLNTAASGEAGVPESPGGSVEAPSGYELHDVAASVVGNYGVAYQWRAEALGWREWYSRQKAAWDKP